MEALLAILLAVLAVVTVNLVTLVVSVSFFLMVLRQRLGWAWWPGQVLIYAPVLLALTGALGGSMGILGPPGQVIILTALSVVVYS